MCQINTDPMVQRSGYFEVQVPPSVVHKDSNTDIVAREGDNVTLSCDATGHPKPLIVWRREDGEDILVGGKKVSAVESPNLRLSKISRLQMGDYLCVASNGVAPSTSKMYKVRVQCKDISRPINFHSSIQFKVHNFSSSNVLDPQPVGGGLPWSRRDS